MCTRYPVSCPRANLVGSSDNTNGTPRDYMGLHQPPGLNPGLWCGLRRAVRAGQPQVMEIVARDLRKRFGMLVVTVSWFGFGLPEVRRCTLT